MNKERRTAPGKIGRWVSKDLEVKLKELSASLKQQEKEREEQRKKEEYLRKKRKQKSQGRRWKNLRGTWEVDFLSQGILQTARFRWDQERSKDVIEIPLSPSESVSQGQGEIMQSAMAHNPDWVKWEVENNEDEKKWMIVCNYRSGNFARLNTPEKRVRLVFNCFRFPVLGVKGVSQEKIPKPTKPK